MKETNYEKSFQAIRRSEKSLESREVRTNARINLMVGSSFLATWPAPLPKVMAFVRRFPYSQHSHLHDIHFQSSSKAFLPKIS